jgi:hypothetical protein
MSADNALQYVGPIKSAYANAEKAGASALGYALECGKHLNAALKTVTAAKGKWKSWREKYLPEVSEETERLYRRLADAVARDEDFFAECKSIRDAIKHRAKYDDDLKRKPETVRKPKEKASGSSATGLSPPEAATPSTGPDLANLAADELCTMLVAQWEDDALRDLAKRINEHLSKKSALFPTAGISSGATNSPTQPSGQFVRRPLEQPRL